MESGKKSLNGIQLNTSIRFGIDWRSLNYPNKFDKFFKNRL